MKKGISHAGQRKTPRTSTVIQVDYHTTDHTTESFFRDFVDDISAGGMFIATPKPLEPGTQLRLEFLLPGCDYPIRVNGEVTWSRSVSSEGQRRGMGVKFDGLSSSAKDKINTIIKQPK
jgi:uncharacterized protein (TIGR02266 family)